MSKALGIGERIGDFQIDLLLVNLTLTRYIERYLTRLDEGCTLVSHPCGVPFPPNYPSTGEDAFRTVTSRRGCDQSTENGAPALAYAVYSRSQRAWSVGGRRFASGLCLVGWYSG